MHDDFVSNTAIELAMTARQREHDYQQRLSERAEDARKLADEARLALAELAEPATMIIALKLAGATADGNGRPIDKERVDTAWEVLTRIGVPRLRATPVAAPMSAATNLPSPDSPGWADEDDDLDDDQIKEIDPNSVDAQIDSFMQGVNAARDLKGDS